MLQKTILIIVFLGFVMNAGITKAQAPDVPFADKPVEQIVEYYFGNKAPIMMAIFKAESGLNAKAVHYNCMYGKKSTSCLPGDEPKAWSVDCGVAQINFSGKTCPKYLLDPVQNLSKAKEKLDTEGLNAWVVYWNGAYKKYL